jgi:hypothetical protein
MPLRTGDTPADFSANVAELIRSGKFSRAQALAIAYKTRREGRRKEKERTKKP